MQFNRKHAEVHGALSDTGDLTHKSNPSGFSRDTELNASLWERSAVLPLRCTKLDFRDHFPHPSLQSYSFFIPQAMPLSFAVLNVRSLFSLATSLIACSFLIMYTSWHTHSPSISPFPNPKFLDLKVPLWSLLVGASHFGKILCKQPELSNLSFKAFLKLFLQP